MAIKDVCSSGYVCPVVVCTAAVMTAITFLVLGILGRTGHVPMHPIGARIMTTIGSVALATMIFGAIKLCCRNN